MRFFQPITLLVLLAGLGFAQERKPAPVLAQKQLGKNACGPCAFVNSLTQAMSDAALKKLSGTNALQKAETFATVYGGVESMVYGPARTAYHAKHGIAHKDLLMIANRFAADADLPLFARELVRRNDKETPSAFLSRFERTINESIKAGFPPVLGVRSVAASKKDGAKIIQWHTISGHWVSVVGVERPSPDEDMLLMRFADSLSGKILTGLVHFEPRNAVIPMTFTLNEKGKEQWTWIPANKGLFLSAPSMPMGTERAQWYQRSYLSLRGLIHLAPGDGEAVP